MVHKLRFIPLSPHIVLCVMSKIQVVILDVGNSNVWDKNGHIYSPYEVHVYVVGLTNRPNIDVQKVRLQLLDRSHECS